MAARKLPLRLGLQARITALAVLGLVGVFAVLGYIGLRNQAASMDVVLQQRVALAQTIAAHVDYHVGNMLTELGAATEYPGFDLSDDSLEHERHALADLYRQGMFYDVFLTEALAPIIQARNQILVAAIVVLAAAVLVVWLTTRQVTRPVLAVAEAARRAAEAELSAPLPGFGSDEVGQLGRDFAAMRRKLAAWGDELETAVLHVPLSLPVIRRSLDTGEPILLPDIDRDAPEMRGILVRGDIRAFFARS